MYKLVELIQKRILIQFLSQIAYQYHLIADPISLPISLPVPFSLNSVIFLILSAGRFILDDYSIVVSQIVLCSFFFPRIYHFMCQLCNCEWVWCWDLNSLTSNYAYMNLIHNYIIFNYFKLDNNFANFLFPATRNIYKL